ncbi:hypothetical protein SAMN05880566_112191 [Janthinobacterium sp. TND4EL3]|nr:hypothetical protein SAMN05880566_112191 [Janthinobacterium sp. TND4EL3]
MNRAELLQLTSHVLIVIATFILYRTGSHITRVWSEMRTELWLLRSLMKNHCVTGEEETRAGPMSIASTKAGCQSPMSEKTTVPPGS